MLSEISQAEKVSYMVSLTCGAPGIPWRALGEGKGKKVLEGKGVEGWVSLVVGIKERTYCMED